jgi:hypothetical protein
VNRKGCERKRSCPNWNTIPTLCRGEELRKATKNLNQCKSELRPRFEPCTSRIQVRNAAAGASRLGVNGNRTNFRKVVVWYEKNWNYGQSSRLNLIYVASRLSLPHFFSTQTPLPTSIWILLHTHLSSSIFCLNNFDRASSSDSDVDRCVVVRNSAIFYSVGRNSGRAV